MEDPIKSWRTRLFYTRELAKPPQMTKILNLRE